MTEINSKPDWAQGARDRKRAARIEQGLKPRGRPIVWLILGAVAIGTMGLLLTRPAPKAAVPAATEAQIVKQIRRTETTVVAQAPLQNTVRVTGTLVPIGQAEVAAQVSARVLDVLV